ncbi:MAG: hypothetical protein ACRCT6_12755, partial [Notoacmeibacter sp.]
GYIKHSGSLSITDQISKWSKYSELKAHHLFLKGKKPRYLRLLFNPMIYFFRFYVIRRLFLCGVPGFLFSMASGAYSFMTEARLIELTIMAKAASETQKGGTAENGALNPRSYKEDKS